MQNKREILQVFTRKRKTKSARVNQNPVDDSGKSELFGNLHSLAILPCSANQNSLQCRYLLFVYDIGLSAYIDRANSDNIIERGTVFEIELYVYILYVHIYCIFMYVYTYTYTYIDYIAILILLLHINLYLLRHEILLKFLRFP